MWLCCREITGGKLEQSQENPFRVDGTAYTWVSLSRAADCLSGIRMDPCQNPLLFREEAETGRTLA